MTGSGVGLGDKGGDRDMGGGKGGRIQALGSGLGTKFWRWCLPGWARGGQVEGSGDKAGRVEGPWRRSSKDQGRLGVWESGAGRMGLWGSGLEELGHVGAEL